MKIPKGYSESVNRRTDNTMAKKKVQKDEQRFTKHTYNTKDQVTITPLKAEGELKWSGSVSSSCSTSENRRVNLVTNPVISYERGINRETLLVIAFCLCVKVNALVFGYILFGNELTAWPICKAFIPSPRSIPFGLWVLTSVSKGYSPTFLGVCCPIAACCKEPHNSSIFRIPKSPPVIASTPSSLEYWFVVVTIATIYIR